MLLGNRFTKQSFCAGLLVAAALLFTAGTAKAVFISVAGPNSSAGTAPAIIGAPANALDDVTTNSGMQGFDEAQGVVTTVAHAIDGGVIPAGTRVNSHMIFLNSQGTFALSHFGVDWAFANPIIGVMSDVGGTFEAASTFELGAPATNYTLTFGGSGPAAPFPNRGLEGNNGTGLGGDGYQLLAANILRVGMFTTEPGDWIRVITAADLPEPATITLFGFGLAGLGLAARRRRG